MKKTEDGFEESFAVNTLGTFALTELLMPLLAKSTQESSFVSRVITISSGGMLLEPLVVNDIRVGCPIFLLSFFFLTRTSNKAANEGRRESF